MMVFSTGSMLARMNFASTLAANQKGNLAKAVSDASAGQSPESLLAFVLNGLPAADFDNAVRNVPDELAGDRWTFVRGDVRQNLAALPADTGHLFVDAAHGARFARWYLAELFPRVPSGIPVSVHDVHAREPRRDPPHVVEVAPGLQRACEGQGFDPGRALPGGTTHDHGLGPRPAAQNCLVPQARELVARTCGPVGIR